jgi:uncharacterized membrane protein YeaQ/YmgE (transglycosylase-associated protein family)
VLRVTGYRIERMNIIYFLLIGLVAGWLAGKYMEGRGFGLIGNLLVGVVGAVLGGFLFRLLGIAAHSLLGELVTATLGAILFLYLIQWHRRGP